MKTHLNLVEIKPLFSIDNRLDGVINAVAMRRWQAFMRYHVEQMHHRTDDVDTQLRSEVEQPKEEYKQPSEERRLPEILIEMSEQSDDYELGG